MEALIEIDPPQTEQPTPPPPPLELAPKVRSSKPKPAANETGRTKLMATKKIK